MWQRVLSRGTHTIAVKLDRSGGTHYAGSSYSLTVRAMDTLYTVVEFHIHFARVRLYYLHVYICTQSRKHCLHDKYIISYCSCAFGTYIQYSYS